MYTVFHLSLYTLSFTYILNIFFDSTQASMLAPIERFLKQAIVDKSPTIASAALISSYHLVDKAKELVRRWTNEIQEAFSTNKRDTTPTGYFVNQGYIVQYHALGLLYLLKQQDRMAVVKLLQTSTKHGTVRSQWAQCMLIRFAAKCCEDESAMNGDKNLVSDSSSLSFVMYEYLKSLCSNNDMVMLEAARALCNMVTTSSSSLTASQVQPAIQALQHLLTSPKPTLKFAALRTLNRLAHINPSLVVSCNLDMEALISDQNRSVATFAITTLLKTGTEAGVDRLMKQISSFMNEISDEFKVIVIDAIRVLAVKFPSKQTLLLNFLNSVLREEGGYEYKKSVVDAIFDLTKRLPECMETALPHLCEFIEDCEFTRLAVRILHLLGVEGPKTKDPSKFIRYIYNRVILENSHVRAAAVNALASFGCQVASLKDSVRGLLARCLDDPDDEVRDRATFTLGLLDQQPALQKKYLLNEVVFSLSSLQSKLDLYQAAQDYSNLFDDSTVQRVPINEFLESTRPKSPASPMAMTVIEPIKLPTNANLLSMAPSLDMDLGELFKSSNPVDLTEKEMEYVVQCVKHIYSEYIVFQFKCINTLPDALLTQVKVQMVAEDLLGLTPYFEKAAEILVYQEPASIFVGFKKPKAIFPLIAFQNTLKYIIRDCDKVTHEPDSEEGFDDEYEVFLFFLFFFSFIFFSGFGIGAKNLCPSISD
ncbi:coatomer subunit gamma [Coelomomyces lativittatus]|nr:coatomer subunit gamma [Coelomomyces lativittatus]